MGTGPVTNGEIFSSRSPSPVRSLDCQNRFEALASAGVDDSAHDDQCDGTHTIDSDDSFWRDELEEGEIGLHPTMMEGVASLSPSL